MLVELAAMLRELGVVHQDQFNWLWDQAEHQISCFTQLQW